MQTQVLAKEGKGENSGISIMIVREQNVLTALPFRLATNLLVCKIIFPPPSNR
jgi:hypothetical protein